MNPFDQTVSIGTRNVPLATVQWLQSVPWQLFATLEFPYLRTRYEPARLKFAEMVNTVERSLRTRLGYLYAMETRSKSGAVVPLHFHAAFTAIRPIPDWLVAGVWNQAVGRSNSVGGDLALVEPYDPSMGGIEYIVKQVGDPNCEWDCRNVHLFSNSIQLEPKSDHASLRSARRWQQQVSIAAA